jgi:hypothetical protein
MTLRLKPYALLLAVTAAVAADAASPPPADAVDPFLSRLEGDWDMVGTVQGKPVRHHGTGRWVLKKSWLCLSIVDVGNPPAYEASVYLGFDKRAHGYIAHWLDQFGAAGARVVGTGQREGETLVVLFPYGEGAFRDTFSLAAGASSGSLLLESQEKDGHWSTFASYRLTRHGP